MDRFVNEKNLMITVATICVIMLMAVLFLGRGWKTTHAIAAPSSVGAGAHHPTKKVTPATKPQRTKRQRR